MVLSTNGILFQFRCTQQLKMSSQTQHWLAPARASYYKQTVKIDPLFPHTPSFFMSDSSLFVDVETRKKGRLHDALRASSNSS